MSCLTCDHTVHLIANGVFWCPRCGTARSNAVYVPALVDRVRRFIKDSDLSAAQVMHCHRIGILEAVYLPYERPDQEPPA